MCVLVCMHHPRYSGNQCVYVKSRRAPLRDTCLVSLLLKHSLTGLLSYCEPRCGLHLPFHFASNLSYPSPQQTKNRRKKFWQSCSFQQSPEREMFSSLVPVCYEFNDLSKSGCQLHVCDMNLEMNRTSVLFAFVCAAAHAFTDWLCAIMLLLD